MHRTVVIFTLGATLLASACSDSVETKRDAGGEPTEAGTDQPDASEEVDPAAAADAAAELDAGVARLSETGLYADIATGALASGVRPFVPQGTLWSDGADKQRWVYLPQGAKIDSSNMDAWQLPVGTKLWKEFKLGDKRLETRLLEKTAPETWTMVAYQWQDDQRDALALPDGAEDVAGTQHDIPSSKDCQRCHEGVADTAIGFSAVLLDHANAGVSLSELAREGLLSKAPAAPLAVPGTAQEQKALLYLHANCSNCHNDRTFISNVTDVDYSLTSSTLAAVDQTNAHRTIQRDLRKSGSVEKTQLIRRMGFRGIQGQMPPIGSERIDQEGLGAVQAWVSALYAARDAGAGDAGVSDAGLPDAAPDAGP